MSTSNAVIQLLRFEEMDYDLAFENIIKIISKEQLDDFSQKFGFHKVEDE